MELKSRVQSLQDGDANTIFFYLSTLHRRRSNRIHALKDHARNRCYDDLQIHGITLTHFTHSLQQPTPQCSPLTPDVIKALLRPL